MKKLSKIKLKDTDFMDDNEMKMVTGGQSGFGCYYQCNGKCGFDGGSITGTCIENGSSCDCDGGRFGILFSRPIY